MKETKTEALAFRVPMPVTQLRLMGQDGAYPLCPQCRITLEREYQCFCDRCGQRLSWKYYSKAQVISTK